jgi:prolyl-tRNA editing enzyme YbaK/EbsC (Cys-tRNA(Pro) deacylase)
VDGARLAVGIGRRGLQAELRPNDLVSLTGARIVVIRAGEPG